jgi:hypothetical protein
MENDMNGFDDFDTQVSAEEFYEAEQDYFRELAEDQQVDQLCTMCQTHEAVEDGFCSFQCENLFHDQTNTVEPSGEDAYDGRYDDFLSQYDDEPDVYAGTYSEE